VTDTPAWPDNVEEAAALLRERAKKEPIDSGYIPWMLHPWGFLWRLSTAKPAVRDVVTGLLDDPDPRVARRAIVYFEKEKRSDAMFERFLAMAERITPGPTADELQRVLSTWITNDAEARRVAAAVRRLSNSPPAPTNLLATYKSE
jgi:hypothetical protein